MKEEKAGIQISAKAFLSSVGIIGALMIVAGILTRVIPAGSYERIIEGGREVIIPDSFTFTDGIVYPIWRWLTAPIEVLWGPDNVTIISIVAFIMIIGGTFAILDKSGILKYIMNGLVRKYEGNKYMLMGVMIFFFMFFGSVFGMFEELVALVPIVVLLSYAMGWDSLVGLGMSALAAGFGFSTAMLNPFTLGIAQNLAGLPMFSGVLLRIPMFVIVYLILFTYVKRYAKQVEKDSTHSLVFEEDRANKERYSGNQVLEVLPNEKYLKKSVIIFTSCLGAVIIYIMVGLIMNTVFDNSALSDISLIVMALLFLVGGLVAGKASRYTEFTETPTKMMKDFLHGIGGIAPGAILILMAMSVKYIITMGGVMDTILYYASEQITGMGPYTAALLIFALVLALNFFVGSGSAKAFLVIPIIAPLTDLVDVTRQTAVQAFCFGDGFSNMIYPTNPLLMIALSVTVVSYPKWFKFTWKLQAFTLAVCGLILIGTVFIGYGPF
ncbi:MAG: AbgT family transporter [Anaerovoracaceae bacterium]